MIFWSAAAVLLFAVSGSTWRDLVSRPAGTTVHVLVKGSELVPWLKTLAMLTVLLALVSLFANRLVIVGLSALAGIFALIALVATFGKLGGGPSQAGVVSHFFWLPAIGAIVGILGVFALALLTWLSVSKWSTPRYRSGKSPATPIDLWRAQDAGTDPTAE